MKCEKCGGSGLLDITCKRCGGTGWVGGRYGGEICCGGTDEMDCPDCDGTGEIKEEDL